MDLVYSWRDYVIALSTEYQVGSRSARFCRFVFKIGDGSESDFHRVPENVGLPLEQSAKKCNSLCPGFNNLTMFYVIRLLVVFFFKEIDLFLILYVSASVHQCEQSQQTSIHFHSDGINSLSDRRQVWRPL